ncbi:putative MFS monocarboxylate transporter [Aspergillus neoniger CBS 115656]|uniref:MFS general substrate transporter n=1 Tax=Aspergillus neoniger (strain CBS 115656) TaxID=1448310 RepID=A0A318YGY4_ASPNB|nr:MFS general substrate transporter [Aspergillus neoniger CBS 115656]PYH33715.1 MFS general substrate transporter [Aspergillus neoniger CBS 115656]
MRSYHWPSLIAALVQFTAAANITILGPGDLHQGVADSFLFCLNATGIYYRLYIDAGITIVLSPKNRGIDTEDDEFLLQCMMMACDTMSIAAEDMNEDNENHINSVYAFLVTYDSLVEQGAQGLRAIGTRPALTLEDIAVRDGGENENEGLGAPDEFSVEHNEHQAPAEASPERQPVPDGGLEGWLSVLAGFCVFVNSWGLISCYGAFQEFYQTVLLPDESPSTISWIGSIQATLIVMVGMVTGPLVDAGYLRPLILTGSFLVVFGMMMLSLATEYYQVLLAQGFCVGIGGGITYIPAMVVISSYFTTRRPIAIGCASIGSSVGSVIFPILFRQVQPIINFAWSVRCIAFINLFLALITCAILCRRPGKKTRTRSLIELKALTHLPFMLLSLSMTCVMLAYYVPIFYIATYARSALNTPTSLSFYLVSITNGASAFGRTVPYLLASGGTRIKPIFILITFVAAAAVAMFTWIATTNTAGFIVWACYWGFVSGVLVTAPTSIVAHKAFCPDSDFLGTRMGMMWGISSFGSLVGTPVAGALVNLETADFVRAQVFAGCLMVGAVVLQVWPVVCVVRADRGVGKVQ